MQNKPPVPSTYKASTAKQQGSPIMLLVGAAALSICFYACYKQLYAPWASRKRMARAEQFADLLYEDEMNKNGYRFEGARPAE